MCGRVKIILNNKLVSFSKNSAPIPHLWQSLLNTQMKRKFTIGEEEESGNDLISLQGTRKNFYIVYNNSFFREIFGGEFR